MQSATKALKQPALFLSHGGGPCFFMEGGMFKSIDKHSASAQFYRDLAKDHLPEAPKAIVVVSAHWVTPGDTISITANPNVKLMYDYYGFPAHTYELKWPAPCDLPLASHIQNLLKGSGVSAQLDSTRDFDHGVFVPLKLAFPEANIPVVQVSLSASLSPTYHQQIGKLLAPLRDEGILIVGSGMSSHNMRDMQGSLMRNDDTCPPYTTAWARWLDTTLALKGDEREKVLNNWIKEAPEPHRIHPRGGEEHFAPIFVASAASTGPGKKIHELLQGTMYMSSYIFED